ncbi:hypothetical protein R6Q57_027282 [Mikania cordata]
MTIIPLYPFHHPSPTTSQYLLVPPTPPAIATTTALLPPSPAPLRPPQPPPCGPSLCPYLFYLHHRHPQPLGSSSPATSSVRYSNQKNILGSSQSYLYNRCLYFYIYNLGLQSYIDSTSIGKVRLNEADPAIIKVLANKGIRIKIDAANDDIPAMAGDENFTKSLIGSNVLPYYPELKTQLLPVMKNLQAHRGNQPQAVVVDEHKLVLQELGLLLMEGDESKPPSPPADIQNNEHSERLAENVEGFQQFIDEVFELIEKDEKFHEMTAISYDQKKCYIRGQLLELSLIHNSLANHYADLIEQVSKNCPSLLQKQHLETSDSSLPSHVTQMLAPNVTSGFDVFWHPGCTGLESFMPSSVNKPPVPPVDDDYLKVKEDTNISKGEGLSVFGLEPFTTSVCKPLIQPLNDDVLEVKEIKDSCSESEVLLEKISNLEEEVVGLKQKLQSLTDENGELKLEIEENITDVRLYMSESKLEFETMKEESKASKETEISQLNSTHEKKEKIWNGVTGQLKDNLKEKCELVDELSKKMNRKDGQLDILWAERRSQDNLIHQLKTKLNSIKFSNIQKLTDEVKLKVVEIEREKNKQGD